MQHPYAEITQTTNINWGAIRPQAFPETPSLADPHHAYNPQDPQPWPSASPEPGGPPAASQPRYDARTELRPPPQESQ
eukprot:11319389-Karenia_brevis.AAC.1